MLCPSCNSGDLRVTDSRPVGKDTVRRRRECNECGIRFTTREVIQLAVLEVLKRDGTCQVFSADKFRQSVESAVAKRSVDRAWLNTLLTRVLVELGSPTQTTLPSSLLAQKAQAILAEIDPVAYVRYVTVSRGDIKNLNDLSQLVTSARKAWVGSAV